MISLIKRDFLMLRVWDYLSFIIFIFLFQIAGISPLFIYSVLLIGIPVSFFFYDAHYQVNRFVHSLPVSARSHVISRYISSSVLMAAVLILQMIIPSPHTYSLYDIVILFIGTIFIIAIVIPIYHLFKTVYLPSILLFVVYILSLYITWNALEVKEITKINEDGTSESIASIEEAGNLSYSVEVYFDDPLTFIKNTWSTEMFSVISLVVIALCLASCFISIRLFKRKELV